MIALALVAAVATGPSPIDQAGNGDLLAAAESAYRAGLDARTDAARARPHFVRAAELYEAIWDQGNRTPATARNMAQCRYLAGDVGRSIQDYRRGLKAFPHNGDLRVGLAFAREQVAYPLVGEVADAARPVDSPSAFDRLRIPVHRLAWVAIGLSALGWFVLARAWFTARGGLALFGGALVFAALALGAGLWWEDSRQRARWTQPAAVVLAPGTDLRTGNSDEYPKRLDGRLPAGVEVKVLGERGGWLQVELASGAIGWVAKERVSEVN
jgi:Bacterial SH3 domain